MEREIVRVAFSIGVPAILIVFFFAAKPFVKRLLKRK
jgi:hypothetical protein